MDPQQLSTFAPASLVAVHFFDLGILGAIVFRRDEDHLDGARLMIRYFRGELDHMDG